MMPDRHAEIAKRAYTLWEREDRPTGKDLDHWFRAEAAFETTQQAQTVKDARSKARRRTTKRG